MTERDPFDLWCEWATKDRATDYGTIDSKVHNVVMMLTPQERAARNGGSSPVAT